MANPKTAIVRILAAGERPVGVGVLVDDYHIVTCAHVVNSALQRDRNAPDQPSAPIIVDFPLPALNPATDRRQAVADVAWDIAADVAVLALEEPPPAKAAPLPFVLAADVWEHDFRAFGVPKHYPEGTWATGRLRGPTADGTIQLEDTNQTGYFLQPGFSGGPVWDETLAGVVGIVVAADRDETTRAGRYLPASAIRQVWPALPVQESAAQANLRRYLEAIRNRHRALNFSPFQTGHENEVKQVPLDRFYVPLRVAASAPSTPDLQKPDREKEERPAIVSNQILADTHHLSRHLVLLGDAGSGKTTILRHLTGVLARARLEADPTLARAQTGFDGPDLPLPLFVPLRHYRHYCREETGRKICRRTFFEFLDAYFGEDDLTLGANFYRDLLKSGRVLLCLDGFDEVPTQTDRRQMITLINNLAADADIGRNRFILSSRVAAYGDTADLGRSFHAVWVQPLNRAERAEQVRHWVREMAPYAERPLDADDILKRMPEDSQLDQLAVTPMIVTTLCVVYFYDHDLPQQRAELYRRCVDIMLWEKLRPDDPGQALAKFGGDPDLKRDLLARLAFYLHLEKQEEAGHQQAAGWLQDGFKGLSGEERPPAAERFLAYIAARGTLVQERNHRFGFGRQHLTFQEFLAGYYWSMLLRPRQRQQLGHWPRLLRDDRWREPLRLAVGAAMPKHAITAETVLAEMLDLAGAATDPALRLAGYRLAAEALDDLGRTWRIHLDKDLQDDIIDGLARVLFEDESVYAPAADLLPERALAGEVLGRLGDPRPGVATLPPRMVDIPGGPFTYQDGQTRTLPAFKAAVYPVTNAQFKLFVDARGYKTPDWWSRAGRAWLEDPPSYRTQPVSQPEYWHDARFSQPNQPVVGVSWYEAEAFCHWLSAETGVSYRLPSEEEWERLARGTDGRAYPWGPAWTDGLANTVEANLGRPSAVGLFPGGHSPTSCLDCAGNVWEWTNSWYDLDQDARVLRGGSWYNDQSNARCSYRGSSYPHNSNNNYGFRLVSP